MDQLTAILQVGARFKICSQEFEVGYVGKDGIRASHVAGGNTRNYRFSHLQELLKLNSLEIIFTPPYAQPDSRAGLTDAQCASLDRRLAYVRMVHRFALHPGSQREIESIIAKGATELEDSKPPHASTVAGWVKKWVDRGCCEAALMPALKPSRLSKTEDTPLERIIAKTIQDVYLTSQRNAISHVHSQLMSAIAEYNQHAKEPLSPPSYETLRKRILRIDRYLRDVARHGKRYANRKHRAAGISLIATEVLERVEADGQMVDIVLCETLEDGTAGKEIGRAYITAIIDVYSRAILAFFVSLAPFCAATLMKTLGIACLPDGTNPRGVPLKLIIDNGCDYMDSGFLRACNRLGIIVEPCAPRAPNGKPHIERFFRTLSEDLIHKLPGTTFANPEQRGEYDSQEMARLTLPDLQNHVSAWIEEHYNRRLHRGTERIPIQLWRESLQQCPVRTITPLDAELLLRSSASRKVSNGRVEVNGLHWKSHALRQWEVQMRGLGREPRVEVRFDELNLSRVYVVTQTGDTEHVFMLDSCHPRYTEGLSLYEHRRLKEVLRANGIKDRLAEMDDMTRYTKRLEYYAALGFQDDRIARRKLDRLRETLAAQRPTQPGADDASLPKSSTVIESDENYFNTDCTPSPKKAHSDSPTTATPTPDSPSVQASEGAPDAASEPPPTAKKNRSLSFSRQSIPRTPR